MQCAADLLEQLDPAPEPVFGHARSLYSHTADCVLVIMIDGRALSTLSESLWLPLFRSRNGTQIPGDRAQR